MEALRVKLLSALRALSARFEAWRLMKNPEIRYIIEKGVDFIPEVERPKPPTATIIGGVADSIDETSFFLDDPEVVRFFAEESKGRVSYRARLVGQDGVFLLLAASPVKLHGPWFLEAVKPGEWRAFLLVYDGVVTGAQLYESSGRRLYGRAAVRVIEDEAGEVTVEGVRLREKAAEWSNTLTVYVPGIDRQHRFLIATLNLLYVSLLAGVGGRVMDRVLKNLLDYTRFHFRSEEVLMTRYRYPGYNRHHTEHTMFTGRVADFYNKWRTGEAGVTLDVLRFLAQWLRGHIAGSDHSFGEWLVENVPAIRLVSRKASGS